jgi:hypothetical protein
VAFFFKTVENMFAIILSFFTNFEWKWLKSILSYIKGIKWTPLKISIILNVALVVVVVFLFKPQKKVPFEVIVKEKQIMIPAKVGVLDTIYNPQQIPPSTIRLVKNPINQKLLRQYNSLLDSISRLQFVKQVITEREYNEVYEDNFVKIDIYTNVIGTMLKQAPKYTIKPSKVVVQDTVTIHYNKPPSSKILGGLELGIPIQGDQMRVKGSMYLQNKKDNILSVGFDSGKTVWLGYIIKL